MERFRKPVFLNPRSHKLHAKALEQRRSPPSPHYPVGYAFNAEEAGRALRRRFPGNPAVKHPRDPLEHDDAFVFSIEDLE